MLDRTASIKALRRLLQRFRVADMDTLCRTLKTRSRMSIFRRLAEIGYFSSYTHAGRYYTLSDIPQFDDYGLWIHQGIGFSRFGTLKATIIELVDRSPAGLTHIELKDLLHVRVHNTLLNLVRDGRIERTHIDRTFLYVSTVPDQAAGQISRRHDTSKTTVEMPATMVIEVLIETIHAGGRMRIIPSLIAKRLCARSVPITVKQVEQVFTQYGIHIEKKLWDRSRHARGFEGVNQIC